MPLLNIVCPICAEDFKNSDDIYSTSCGHVFHFACMRDWRTRSTSCPHCQSSGPTTHKLYLNFDDADETATKELELKLKDLVEKNLRLESQKEELTRGLKEKDRQLEDSEANFLHLQQQYTEVEENHKELREKIEVLTIENEYKLKEMSLNSIEIEALKTTLERVECATNEKIETFVEKLKHITSDFEKEFSNSTKLQIDQMTLNSYVDRMKLETEKDESGKKGNENLPIENNSTNSTKLEMDQLKLSSYIERMKLETEKDERGKKGNENLAIENNSTNTTKLEIDQMELNGYSELIKLETEKDGSVKNGNENLAIENNSTNSTKLEMDQMELNGYIEALKTTLEQVECATNEKIKILVQKLKHITAEFEKEISDSTKLQIDQMKVNSYVERMKLKTEKDESGKKGNENLAIENNSTNSTKLDMDQLKLSSYIERMKLETKKYETGKNANENFAIEKKSENSTKFEMKLNGYIDRMKLVTEKYEIGKNGNENLAIENNCTTIRPKKRNTKQKNVMNSTVGCIPHANDFKVLIENYPTALIFYPLKDMIIKLTSAMDFIIRQEDLVEVKIMETTVLFAPTKTLVVEFISVDLRNKFLTYKHKLNRDLPIKITMHQCTCQ